MKTSHTCIPSQNVIGLRAVAACLSLAGAAQAGLGASFTSQYGKPDARALPRRAHASTSAAV